MFRQMIAIDVADRVPDFLTRAKACATHVVCARDAKEAMTLALNPSEVEGIVISIHQALSEEMLEIFSALRYIGVLGTSLKKLPLEYCRSRHIKVTNVTEYCDEDTAEWVMFKIINHFRTRTPSRSAGYKTLGIIGTGAVGKHVIHMASAFHMNIVFNSSREQPELVAGGALALSKEEIFQEADVVSIHTPAFLPWLSAAIVRKARENLCIVNTCMGRISVGQELETILTERPDIYLIMDKIAGDNYPDLKSRAEITADAAFLTKDAELRLIDKFFTHVMDFLRVM